VVERIGPSPSTSSCRSARSATSAVTALALSTAAKSRTRRSRRPAIRGVPRERRAISAAPSEVMATFSTPAPRVTIVSSSAWV
jgi:hypothetical protein